MTTLEEHAAIGNKLIQAEKDGDDETTLAMLHPDLEINEPDSLPWGGEYYGVDGFNEVFSKILALGDVEFVNTVIHPTVDGFHMAIDAKFTSKVNGATATVPIVEVARVTDGLVSLMDLYYKDAHGLSVAMGWASDAS